MCCLKYEQDAYEDLVKRAPRMDSFVETPDGVGTVCSVNLLREKVNVRLEDDPETPKCYHNCEVCVVRSGKGKRPEGYVAPPPEQLAKLRRVEETEEQPRREPEDRLAAALAQVLSHDAPEQDKPVQEQEENHRRRRNRGRGHSAKPEGEGHKNEPQPKPEEKKSAPTQKPAGEQKAEGDKKPNRNRHRHRRHRKPGGGQGAAPAQE